MNSWTHMGQKSFPKQETCHSTAAVLNAAGLSLMPLLSRAQLQMEERKQLLVHSRSRDITEADDYNK